MPNFQGKQLKNTEHKYFYIDLYWGLWERTNSFQGNKGAGAHWEGASFINSFKSNELFSPHQFDESISNFMVADWSFLFRMFS